MVEGYTALAGSQTDINRRLLRRIEKLEETIDDLEAQLNSLENGA